MQFSGQKAEQPASTACLLVRTRSYYRKENAADMYMKDILQPKSVFFTVCMI